MPTIVRFEIPSEGPLADEPTRYLAGTCLWPLPLHYRFGGWENSCQRALSPSDRGTCLTLGWSASSEVTIDVRELLHIGRTTLYGLNMMEELNHHGASEDLAWLAQMVAKQKLKTSIEVEASWHEIGDVAQRLLQRQFTGKAVLHLNR